MKPLVDLAAALFVPLGTMVGIAFGLNLGLYIFKALIELSTGDMDLSEVRSSAVQLFDKVTKALGWIGLIASRLWRDMQGKNR